MTRLVVGGAVLVALIVSAVLVGLVSSPSLRQEVADRARRVVGTDDLMRGAHARLDARLNAVGSERGAPVFIRIFKEEAELELWARTSAGWRLAHAYPVCDHSGTLGPKLAEGDRQAPEGFYAVGADQLLPTSRHFRAFNLGFPNAYDRSHGRTGSFLMVHGGCSSIGCYAMTDRGVAEVYTAVEAALAAGQDSVAVHAFPFRMTPERMARAQGSRWIDDWRNLAEGYRLFERTGRVPAVHTMAGRYTFDGEGEAIAAW